MSSLLQSIVCFLIIFAKKKLSQNYIIIDSKRKKRALQEKFEFQKKLFIECTAGDVWIHIFVYEESNIFACYFNVFVAVIYSSLFAKEMQLITSSLCSS